MNTNAYVYVSVDKFFTHTISSFCFFSYVKTIAECLSKEHRLSTDRNQPGRIPDKDMLPMSSKRLKIK